MGKSYPTKQLKAKCIKCHLMENEHRLGAKKIREGKLKVGTKRMYHNFILAGPLVCFTKYKGIKIKDEMGRACSTHGRDEKCVQNSGWKT
jgi:hypothetical protein